MPCGSIVGAYEAFTTRDVGYMRTMENGMETAIWVKGLGDRSAYQGNVRVVWVVWG